MNIEHVIDSDGTQAVNVTFSSPEEIIDYLGMISYINITNYIFDNKDNTPEEELAIKVYKAINEQMNIIMESSNDISNNPDNFNIQKYINELTSVLK